MDLADTFNSRAIIFCLRSGFRRIRSLSVLTIAEVRMVRGLPDLGKPSIEEDSTNLLIVRLTILNEIFSCFNQGRLLDKVAGLRYNQNLSCLV